MEFEVNDQELEEFLACDSGVKRLFMVRASNLFSMQGFLSDNTRDLDLSLFNLVVPGAALEKSWVNDVKSRITKRKLEHEDNGRSKTIITGNSGNITINYK